MPFFAKCLVPFTPRCPATMITLGPTFAFLASQRTGFVKPIISIFISRECELVFGFCRFEGRFGGRRWEGDWYDDLDGPGGTMNGHPLSTIIVGSAKVPTVFATLTICAILSTSLFTPVYGNRWSRYRGGLALNFGNVLMGVMTIRRTRNAILKDEPLGIECAQTCFCNPCGINLMAVVLKLSCECFMETRVSSVCL